MKIGFLVPTITSGNVERWRLAIEHAAEDFGSKARTILYVHWDDPVIIDALEGFDCVFFFPSSEQIPERIIEKLREAGRSVIVLEQDLSAFGIASVCLFPNFFVQRLLDLLGDLGHRSIDCFNIQTLDPIINGRIEQWELWRAMHKFPGQLLGEPVKPFTPYERQLNWAYQLMSDLIKNNQIQATSIFCTTALAAIGAMRAMRDAGIKIGENISVCTINDEGLAKYICPSLTCVEMPDPSAYIRLCIERMQSNDTEWTGSLLIQPSNPPIFKGESTAIRPSASQ
jgi:DNA-binding LacI/PurR family transcriptional regulator